MTPTIMVIIKPEVMARRDTMDEVILSLSSSSCNTKMKLPNEIIRIKGIRLSDDEVVESYDTLVKPKYTDKLCDKCTEETGLTYEDLVDAPSLDEIVKDFHEFIQGAKIFSSGSYDKNLIINELKEKDRRSYASKLIRRAFSSNYYNLISYYNFIFNETVKNREELSEKLKISKDIVGIEVDFETFKKIEELSNQMFIRNFPIDRVKAIIDELNEIHYEFHELKLSDCKSIVQHVNKYTKTVKNFTIMEFLIRWSDMMIIDNSYHNCEYLTMKEISVLMKQVDFQRNLALYMQQ